MAYTGSRPFPVTFGGTGSTSLTGVLTGNGASSVTANTITEHGILLGGVSNAVTNTSVGATGTVLSGMTGADPAFSATPTLTSVSFGGSSLDTYTDSTSWTPTIEGGTSAGTTTYTNQTGRYQRIGNIVIVNFNITISAATGTGNVLLRSLPFRVLNVANYVAIGAGGINGFTYPTNTTFLVYRALTNLFACEIECMGATTPPALLQMQNTACTFFGSLVYAT